MACLIYFVALISTFIIAVCATTKIVVPSECEGLRHCDIKPKEYDDYQELIDKYLSEGNGDVHISYRTDVDEDDEEVGVSGDKQNCVQESQMYTPYILKRHVVVQSKNENFEQKIKMVKCKPNEGTACFGMVTEFQQDLSANCVQRTANITLLVYDAKDKIIKPHVFADMNVGCVCEISYTYKKK